MKPIIKALCINDAKGKTKTNVSTVRVIEGLGIENDTPNRSSHRQISIFAFEKMQNFKKDESPINFSDLSMNIVTEGLDTEQLSLDTKIQVGDEVILMVTQIGKNCSKPCSTYKNIEHCKMTEDALFAKVIKGGEIKTGDEIRILSKPNSFAVGIIVISDSAAKGERISTTEALIEKIIRKIAGEVKSVEIIPDDREKISQTLLKFIIEMKVSLILTTGGTGLSPRDNTPEATKDVITKEIPGFSEAMRMQTFNLSNRSILSRAVAGFRGETLIINLPGSPKAVKECLEVVLGAIPHSLEIIKGTVKNCNPQK